MKKIIIPAISLAALLLTGACSIDERTSGGNGDEAMLTLNMGLDGAVQTRAIGDGSRADHLIYAVFDKTTGERIEGIEQVSKDVTFPTTETITLAKGQTYMIAFWAQNKDCAAYEVSDEMVVTINYEGAFSNDEARDAFFKTVEVTVTGDAELDVELTRPFAQLNVGIYESDWTAGEAAGIVISTSRAVVKEAASTLNLLDGTVADPVDVTFNFAKIPTENLSVDLDGDGTPETYKYLSMNYILPNDETTGDASTTLNDLEFTFRPEAGNDITLTQGLDAVPVQRNWRTNIIGQILSGDLSINISIDPGFNGDNNHKIWDGSAEKPETDPDNENTYLITTPAELAWVAEQVNSKTEYFAGKTIKLMNDIDLSGSYWTPVGNVNDYPTVTFKGTFDGQNHVISNLTASDDAAKYAAAGLFGSITGTVKNVTLKNVNIRSTHYAGAVVGYSSTNGATIENCHVDGGTITTVPEYTGSAYDNGDKAGGIIGYYVTDDKVTNCSAKNLTITAYRDLGGIVGCGPQSGMTTDCSVENIILVQDNTNGYESEAVTTVGALGGRDVTNENQPYDGTFASAVTKKVVGNVSNATQLAAALTSDAAQISVTLDADIDLPIGDLGQQTGGSGEYKLGGENTKSILIDLNNHTLNLTTSYMSKLGAKNDDALFTIQNGKMTSSTTGGTWNIYDLTFANCNYKIEDVVFEKSIAFTNDHRTVTMNNVTINEKNGDYYAMWISAVGQNITIDGLTLTSTGRGIKIDEEYVNNPAKVTLNISNSKFTTVSKAAIMVDSKEGAEINVANVDISEVAADPVFTVWIDEDAKDFADNVIVNGAKVRIEGSNEQIVATSNEELAAADIADNATIYLTKGEYVIPATAKGKTVTFIGTGNPEDVEVAVTKVGTGYENCDYGLDGSTVTFEGITITTNSSTYIGYARCKGTYKNCVINGTYTLYGDSKFENCTFNVSGDVYNIWTWGAPNATFDGCTFNSDGKAMLLYGQENTNLTIENSVFNDNGGLTDLKAAIEIGDDYGKSYTLVVNNTAVNGYEINDKGINTGTTLWANKNSMPKERLNVTIDGTDVY